jgi:sigma-B regulation protein RsbU (phosphoserine phosphatase)
MSAIPPITPPLRPDALTRLLDVSRRLGVTADVGDILRVIIDALRDLLDAERATVFEYDAVRHELFATVAHGVSANGADAAADLRFSADLGLAGDAARTRRAVIVADAYADPRFNPDIDRRTGFRTRSILSIPLESFDGELIGVAQVVNRRNGPFGPEDEPLAAALAAQAAVAIKRARLVADREQRLKLERDLELARTIQQQTFPRHLPRLPGYDMAAWTEPAESTGGDIYDVIELDGAPPRAVLMLADATGHGIGPSLQATSIRSMLRIAARLGADLQSMTKHLNRQLNEDMPLGRFITAWIGVLDADRHTLTSFSAGQAPLFHFTERGRAVARLIADDIPFGIAPDIKAHRSRRFDLAPGDLFVALSDGIVETMSPDGEQFGSDRAIESIRSRAAEPSASILSSLMREVEQFAAGAAQQDDRTLVIIRRTA